MKRRNSKAVTSGNEERRRERERERGKERRREKERERERGRKNVQMPIQASEFTLFSPQDFLEHG